jgi:hypothetical protein
VKKHALSAVLVLVALGLAVYLFLDRDSVTENERKGRENSVFVSWRREALQEISLAHGTDSFVLVRDTSPDAARDEDAKGVWRIRTARHGDEQADPVAVERLMASLELGAVVRTPSEAAFGFEAPRATGALRFAANTVTFVLGGSVVSPVGTSYFRVGGGAAVVVSKEFSDALLADSDVYRSRTIVPYLPTDLESIEAWQKDPRPASAAPPPGFYLVRIDDHAYRVGATGSLLSRAHQTRIFAALASMRAESFPTDADAEKLTQTPRLWLILQPLDHQRPRVEMVVGGMCPGSPDGVVVLRTSPTRLAACAPKGSIEPLLADAESLTERRIVSLQMDEIEELRLERIGGKSVENGPNAIEIARKGTGFHERAPASRDLSSGESDAATEFLTRFCASEAVSISRTPTAPFSLAAKVTVRSGEHEERLEVGTPREDGGAALRRTIDGAWLDVDAAVVRRLLPRHSTYTPKAVVVGETRAVTGVSLRCGVPQDLVARDNGLRLVSPAGFETDGSIVQLVDGVLRGRAETWVADADDGSFGLSPDGCHLVFRFADGNTPLTVFLGANGEGGVYASLDSKPGIMVLPRGMKELAGALYVSRTSLRVEPSRIERVDVLKPQVSPPPDVEVQRRALGALSALQVLSLTRDVSNPELVIRVSLADAGAPPHLLTCGAREPPPPVVGNEAKGAVRRCTSAMTNATFLVPEAQLMPIVSREASLGPGPAPSSPPSDHAP